jgi:hypothetical protein
MIDLMQFRLDNTGGHISHLAGAFFGFFYQIVQRNLVTITGYYFFSNLFKKSTQTI